MRTLATLLILFIAASARAEYRVYVLKIEDSTTGQSRTVETTLDDRQYAEYNPVRQAERVSIADTWMCRYYRSDISQDVEQKHCPNPRGPASVPGAPGGLGSATFTDPKPTKP